MTVVWMRILHFSGFTLWIAGMVAMACTMMAGSRNKLAGILADVGATLALISGIYNGIEQGYFKQPWLHIKLTLVAVLVGLHVTLRIRSKRGSPGGGSGILAATLLIVLAIIYVIVMKPMHRL